MKTRGGGGKTRTWKKSCVCVYKSDASARGERTRPLQLRRYERDPCARWFFARHSPPMNGRGAKHKASQGGPMAYIRVRSNYARLGIFFGGVYYLILWPYDMEDRRNNGCTRAWDVNKACCVVTKLSRSFSFFRPFKNKKYPDDKAKMRKNRAAW